MEHEADRIGMELMAKACYDPREMTEVCRKQAPNAEHRGFYDNGLKEITVLFVSTEHVLFKIATICTIALIYPAYLLDIS